MPSTRIGGFYNSRVSRYFLTMVNVHKPVEDFPPLEAATREGLLAIGGDLSEERLVKAYRCGIFPWYGPGEPILWWSPDPRCVIFPREYRPSRSLHKVLRQGHFKFTLDTAFSQVVNECAAPRDASGGTWITPEMARAYSSLHRSGIAHSAEVWQQGNLVGGLYGLALGGVFFGESMFSRTSNASKVALARLLELLLGWGFSLVDCQVSSPHLTSLGAVEIPRGEFVKRLQSGLKLPGNPGEWENPDSP